MLLKKIRSVFFLIFIFFLSHNCKKDKYVEPVCFETDVKPILINKCTTSGCHNSTDKAYNLDLSSYAAIQSSSDVKEIKEVIIQGKMPPIGYSPLTSEEKMIILRWAAMNFSEGTCSGVNTPSCDTTSSITYNNTVKSILDNYCIGCHNAGSPSGGFALDSYNGAKNCATSGRLMGSLKWLSGYSPMPKGSNSKIPDCDIQKIQRWINTGMPN